MTTTQGTETAPEQHLPYRIHEANMGRAQELVAKINRKAVKLGLNPYTMVVSEPIEVPVYQKASGAFSHMEGFEYERGADGKPVVIGYDLYFDVEVIGEMPQIDGWAFVATLDYSEETVITRPVPGVEIDLSAHRPRPADCDHCHSKRQRNETYVLAHTDGRTMQVGSTCIKPYMGLSASGLMWLAGEPFAEMGEMEEREPRAGGYVVDRIEVENLLTVTMGIEQIEGWVSKGVAAEYDKTATISYVMDFIFPYNDEKSRLWVARMRELINWDAAREKAEKVRAWAVSQNGTSEWAINLRALAGQETVGMRNAGLLASAVAGYNREIGEQIKRAATKPSEWVGEPGAKGPSAKIKVNGEIAQAFTSENEWGVSTMYVIQGDGVTYKVRLKGVPFDTGDKVTGEAKVKAHETYRETKQTVIWYAKLSEVVS